MLVKSYQFTGIDFGHLGQLDPNNMKHSGTKQCHCRTHGKFFIAVDDALEKKLKNSTERSHVDFPFPTLTNSCSIETSNKGLYTE